jgi:cellulose synthase (UDP-forming)
VDEDVAAGLSAETLQAYVVQRRRWMLGCLQVFFRDNPLLEAGLPLRHRVGYLASLWYFFFPLARVVFFLTPLWYLLFHLHPLFAELPVLLAYLVPHLLVLPLAASALVPGWPRMLWGTVYECAVAFPLARATLDLLLPRQLAFKVTPKGFRSDRRRFDASSTRLTLAAAGLALVALAKGAIELAAFGIEVEAYAFNLFWAAANLVAVGAALLVAWERPQRRADERIRRRLPARVGREDAITIDLSTSGACVALAPGVELPREAIYVLEGPEPLRVAAHVVWQERVGGEERAGLAFRGVSPAARRAIVRAAWSADGAHAGAHDRRARSQLGMAARLAAGIVRALLPLRERRRRSTRRRVLRLLAWVGEAGRSRALQVDAGAGGVGLVVLGPAAPARGALVPVLSPSGVRPARVVHVRRVLPALWRVGLAYLPAGIATGEPRSYLAG